ncbi:ThiF family adenylyltransferase [Ulvibacterium marinum]|uniref:ThiF family adenylyltransferase n=1 Tax=Ulvibacterium marinum TaxID=2419782 RepID=UPI0024948560|nr:ThiF family adenylyltransferase [Ulvibacterium marinum]
MTYSVAITEEINKKLCEHLIREDGQEDLCFAFYTPCTGNHRKTAIISNVLVPSKGDRNLHGNVSFNSAFFDKATAFALANNLGICFIHSHPGPGWQSMSIDDILAEEMLAPRVKAVTSLPLVGMTLGNDSTWSARFWTKKAPKTYERNWCESVRIIGKGLKLYYCDQLLKKPVFGEEFSRTISAWGNSKQSHLSRIKVGIVGLGSVGSIVAESLQRTGIQNITLIDFDRIEKKNLDRLLAAGRCDIGKFKVDFQKERLLATGVNPNLKILSVPYSISEQEGLSAALDCDVLFSCVDRPLPRFIMDCISFANFIPIIDGGIDANPKDDMSNIDQARWKAHTTGPERICMQCLGQYKPEDVALEQSGELEDPQYIKNLPLDHFVHRGENVFAFSLSLASMEIQQFLSLALLPRSIYYGPKEMDFNTGNIDFNFENECNLNCAISGLQGKGDDINRAMLSQHLAAEKSRNQFNQKLKNKKHFKENLQARFIKFITAFFS